MEKIFANKSKLHQYAQIQKGLLEINSKSDDKAVNNFFNQIPKSFLEQKEDLKVICTLFACRLRKSSKCIRKNIIKLFEKILTPIKNNLQDESYFLWTIFGGVFVLKLWMYEEGLVTLDTIIQAALSDETLALARYFLPEIYAEEPEIYEKQFKKRLQIDDISEYISNIIIVRKKTFKWIRESSDYGDPVFAEIDRNPIRLVLKRDDLNGLKNIIKKTNLSVDSKVTNCIFDNYYISPLCHQTLIDCAINFDSFKIIDYLLQNNAKLSLDCIYSSIMCRNKEMINLVESKFFDDLRTCFFQAATTYWNHDALKHSIEKYDYSYLYEENVSPSKDDEILSIINYVSTGVDFIFFESTILPFLQKNHRFVKDNINKILMNTLDDHSCYFFSEFMKHSKVDVNFHKQTSDVERSILGKAIQAQNTTAVEILLNNPDIDINSPCSDYFLPLQFACGIRSCMKIIRLFCKNPKLNIEQKDSKYDFTAFILGAIKGNFYSFQYILDNFPDYNEKVSLQVISFCINNDHFYCAKVVTKYYIRQNPDMSRNEIIDAFRRCDDEVKPDQFIELIDELMDT